MTVSSSFDAAKAKKGLLLENEAHVSSVSNGRLSPRVWVGYDVANNAVAYFEYIDDPEASFLISKVISVETLATQQPGQGESIRVVKLTCLDHRLEKVFQAFIEDLVVRADGTANILQLINQTAGEWRSLLQTASSGISESRAVGLYGELLFLEESIRNMGSQALAMWQISDQGIHDFIFDERRVEVKTSEFQNRLSVTIHGLKQLDLPVDAQLTLAVAEVQKHGQGESLNEVVQRIIELGVNRDLFLQKLESAGFVIGMPGSSDHTFNLITWRFWEISDESPVLRATLLPPSVRDAISDVRFTLNLSALGEASDTFWK